MIWCPRHPTAKLVRTKFADGKVDLRCPECTADRVAAIKVVRDPAREAAMQGLADEAQELKMGYEK